MNAPRREDMITLTLDDQMPANARKLWTAGLEHGWKVWATRAHKTNDDGSVVNSVAVRLHKGCPAHGHYGCSHVVGVWVDGKFSSGLRMRPFGRLGARELVKVVTE